MALSVSAPTPALPKADARFVARSSSAVTGRLDGGTPISGDLARRLLISPQGVQLALKELERRGLVERKQDPAHGRILQAFLTDQGRKVAEAVVSDALAVSRGAAAELAAAQG